jgi:hypothetical protein
MSQDYIRAEDVAYITGDGDYTANGEILVFDASELSREQWAIVGDLPETERIIYVQKVLDGEDTTDYEDEFHG